MKRDIDHMMLIKFVKNIFSIDNSYYYFLTNI